MSGSNARTILADISLRDIEAGDVATRLGSRRVDSEITSEGNRRGMSNGYHYWLLKSGLSSVVDVIVASQRVWMTPESIVLTVFLKHHI